MTSGYYCAIFPFCGGGKKKGDKKTKAFYDWATTGIPVMNDSRIHRNMKIARGDSAAKLGCSDGCDFPLNASERISEQALIFLLEGRPM